MTTFLMQALVFIGAAVLLVPLFQRLGFGSVLGYLLAGVLVGPHGLKWIQDADSVTHFSELGVVLLLFIIGLEIQPQKLWSMRRELLGLGGLQILLCTLAFTVLGWLLGLPILGAAVIGFALSLSSTAFAVQTLTEKNQFNTQFGQASFAILLMQDLMAIPALAIIPALAVVMPQTDHGPVHIWLALLLIGGLVLTSRYLMRPAFRLIAATRSREIFTLATLLIVLGVAVLMQAVGLSAALGTFIAGVLLAESEYRHELETNISPFKGLLMGLFFMGVGMQVSLALIWQHPILILALTLSYLLIKFSVIYSLGRFFKIQSQNAKALALTISQGGEFAFVIFGMSAQFGFVTNDKLAILTAVVTLSMAVNPLLSMADEWISCKWQKDATPDYDSIIHNNPDVIIAGLGRFGQTFSRILRAQGMGFVAIDHDANQIEMVRKFGNKVYYGDVTREDILAAAGAAQAKYLVLAIDDVELSLKAVTMVQTHFPHLKIFARARNRGHAFDLMDLGVQYIKREVFDSSANFVGDLLMDMGMSPERAERIISRFKKHDDLMMLEQVKVRKDDDNLISVSQQGVMQLEQVLNDESVQSHIG